MDFKLAKIMAKEAPKATKNPQTYFSLSSLMEKQGILAGSPLVLREYSSHNRSPPVIACV